MFLKLVFVIVVINYFSLKQGAAQVNIGSECIIPNSDAKGECTLLKNCSKAIENIRNNSTRPINCGFLGLEPIVCCAVDVDPTVSVNPVSKRVQKCNEYSKSVYEERQQISLLNGSPKNVTVDTCEPNAIPLIIGGSQARSTEFPHYVLLGYNSTDLDNGVNIEWLCGGSLVSSRFVLTAAHCLRSRDNGPVKIARLGDFNDDRFLMNILVEQIYPHPDFTPSKFYHDIALIKLVEKVPFSRFVRPICLPTANESPTNNLIESGWEFNPFVDSGKKNLHKKIVSVITNEECNSYFQPILTMKLRDGIIDQQMCTKNERDRDLCIGDMLQTYNPDSYCMYTQIGIASVGTCLSSPAIYTRLFEYSNWVEGIVWGPGEDD